jgi:hypothetical protein
LLQKPQLNESTCVFVQLAPHCDSLAAQVAEHIPWEHRSPAVQTAPQAPQFAGSEVVLAHPIPHARSPGVQVQAPVVQVCPTPQTVPQLPQFRRSVSVVVQTPLQLV